MHPTLYPKCHHQMIYSKLNLKIDYPPCYMCIIWDYTKSKTDFINHFIKRFGQSNLFYDKNVCKPVDLFNKTLINIFQILIQIKSSYVMTETLLV